MLSNILRKGLLCNNPFTVLPRYASTGGGQETILLVLYEGLML